MQKFLLFIIIFLILSCSGNNTFKIDGKINHSIKSTIYLSRLEIGSSKIVDSTELDNDGSFQFKEKINEPEFYQLFFLNGTTITLLTEPKERINITAEGNKLNTNYKVTGSKGSILIKQLNDHLLKTIKGLDSLSNIYLKLKDSSASDTFKQAIEKEYQALIKQQKLFSKKIIIDNLRSLASIVALYQELSPGYYILDEIKDLQFVKLLSDTLRKYYPSSLQVQSLCRDKEKLIAKYNLLVMTSKSVISDFPDIALPDINNKTVKLSQFKGKNILLLFWSTYNIAGIEMIKKLTPIYNRYHKKEFEIYQVALDNDLKEWVKTLNRFNMPWVNVIDKNAENSYFAKIYNINSIPSVFLITKKGDIISKNIDINNIEKSIKEIIN